jgi:hypothetical protein
LRLCRSWRLVYVHFLEAVQRLKAVTGDLSILYLSGDFPESLEAVVRLEADTGDVYILTLCGKFPKTLEAVQRLEACRSKLY